MKTRPLKIWNGRGWDSAWIGTRRNDRGVEHWNACGYSGADVIRMIQQVAGKLAMSRNELNTYASPCWGNTMNGITPERGVWVERYNGKLDRIV